MRIALVVFIMCMILRHNIWNNKRNGKLKKHKEYFNSRIYSLCTPGADTYILTRTTEFI